MTLVQAFWYRMFDAIIYPSILSFFFNFMNFHLMKCCTKCEHRLCMQFAGSKEIADYRGSRVLSQTLAELRNAVTKKQKVMVALKFKGIQVTDVKSKVMQCVESTSIIQIENFDMHKDQFYLHELIHYHNTPVKIG